MINIIGPFWMYEHTEQIRDIQMDIQGNLSINGKLCTNNNQSITGFTVVYHDAAEAKVLLKQNVFVPVEQRIRKPFIDY